MNEQKTVFRYAAPLTDEKQKNDVFELLCVCDHEFVPPLSRRDSTTQGALTNEAGASPKPYLYFESLIRQQFILLYEEDALCGFISFKRDDGCGHKENGIYVSTLCIAPVYRGRGLLHLLYDELHRTAKEIGAETVTTRTWSTNAAQLKTLKKHGYRLCKAIPNDRGNGIDTLYFSLDTAGTIRYPVSIG